MLLHTKSIERILRGTINKKITTSLTPHKSMDIISHGIWGATIVRRPKLLIPILLSGFLPDLISTATGFLYLQITQGINLTFSWSSLPVWSTALYGYSHGLIGLVIFSILIIIFARNYLILIIPYAFHIFLDLFTHVSDPLARIFYPFVKYSGDRLWGINWWEHPWTSIVSWTLLILINVGLFIYHKYKK